MTVMIVKLGYICIKIIDLMDQVAIIISNNYLTDTLANIINNILSQRRIVAFSAETDDV